MEKVFNELESFDIHEQDSAKQKIAECFAASEYSSTKFQKKNSFFPILFFYYNFHSQFCSISIEVACSFNRSYL